MTKSLPVRCPACRREHAYVPAEYPCSCGAPVAVALLGERAPVQVRERSWDGSWAEVDCPACGSPGQWPQPEFDCPCGTTVRLAPRSEGAPTPPGHRAAERPPFRPLTIRTAYDAVACAADFLRWLGFTEVRSSVPRPVSGVDLRGAGVVGTVDPTTVPTGARDVETVWLHGLAEDARPVAFSLAGFDRQARARAHQLGLALFALDLAGSPQPVNEAGDALLRDGAPPR